MFESDSQNRQDGEEYASGSGSESETSSLQYQRENSTALYYLDEDVDIMGGTDAVCHDPVHNAEVALAEYQAPLQWDYWMRMLEKETMVENLRYLFVILFEV